MNDLNQKCAGENAVPIVRDTTTWIRESWSQDFILRGPWLAGNSFRER
ncbi:hypothetical protein Pla52o_22340 [Novipirellula galeiformis]|uniref:Uncharacterized protein n=1 Tax=Novipirellula galeiformis TaxID=2528004 RepID=A0A5C6CL69_9BACT|nr:hypothetical protein [Novipirellula galeiformis]TWU24307.1 hypothetical protein Pla52o_22340 [Novipirellula galeiformis]